ncbi:MAG: truncated hemoglobin [Planctomycetota bacterium]
MGSPYERIGGEAGVRAVVTRFIRAASEDLMIGFFFRGVDLDALIELEVQLAAAHLGGPRAYAGRPLPGAHAPHPIREGHFQRRLRLLEQALEAEGAPAEVREAWLAHDRALEGAVVAAGGCDAPLPQVVQLRRIPRD